MQLQLSSFITMNIDTKGYL